MISKPLPANSFYHTCRYVLQKIGAEVLIAEGVRGHDYKLMADDFLRQQRTRPSKGKAVFHSILSFHPDERPSDEQLKEIAGKYLERLGIVNTQFTVVKHTDRAHLHVHIIANLVDNKAKAISDSWIGLRGKKVAQHLTQEYGLIPALRKDLQKTNLEALSKSEAIKYKIYQTIAQQLPLSSTMDELEARLKKLGIEILFKFKGQTQERQGVSFKLGGISFKGSQIDRQFSLAGLQKILTEQAKPSPKRNILPAPHSRKVSEKPHGTDRPMLAARNPTSPPSLWGGSTGSGMSKLMEILLQPGFDGGGDDGPDEFTPEGERKKKKGRRHKF